MGFLLALLARLSAISLARVYARALEYAGNETKLDLGERSLDKARRVLRVQGLRWHCLLRCAWGFREGEQGGRL